MLKIILNKGRVRPRFLNCNDCEGLFYSRIEMKTTQGASHNYIMSTTQVPRPRIEPKTLGVTCSYFTITWVVDIMWLGAAP